MRAAPLAKPKSMQHANLSKKKKKQKKNKIRTTTTTLTNTRTSESNAAASYITCSHVSASCRCQACNTICLAGLSYSVCGLLALRKQHVSQGGKIIRAVKLQKDLVLYSQMDLARGW